MVYISSIPPRRGDLTVKVNRDIRRLNRKLEVLSKAEHGLSFVNNWVFLTDEKTTLPGIYSSKPEDDIHLESDGKQRIACAILDSLKNDCYRAEADAEGDGDADWAESV